MRLDLFLQKSSNVFAENRLLKLAMLLIGATALFNTAMLFAAMDRQRTVIHPPGATAEYQVSGRWADPVYLREMSQHVCTLALTYSPVTVRQQFEALLTLHAPEKFPEARETLYRLAETVEMAEATSVFFVQKIAQDEARRRLEITGIRREYIKEQQTDDQPRTFRLDYRIENGRFWIVNFAEKGDA